MLYLLPIVNSTPGYISLFAVFCLLLVPGSLATCVSTPTVFTNFAPMFLTLKKINPSDTLQTLQLTLIVAFSVFYHSVNTTSCVWQFRFLIVWGWLIHSCLGPLQTPPFDWLLAAFLHFALRLFSLGRDSLPWYRHCLLRQHIELTTLATPSPDTGCYLYVPKRTFSKVLFIAYWFYLVTNREMLVQWLVRPGRSGSLCPFG